MIDLPEHELLALIYVLLELNLDNLLFSLFALLHLLLCLSETLVEYLCDLRGIRPHHRQESQILLRCRKHCLLQHLFIIIT